MAETIWDQCAAVTDDLVVVGIQGAGIQGGGGNTWRRDIGLWWGYRQGGGGDAGCSYIGWGW